MLKFEDVLDKTKVLDTKEFVISKGFLKKLREFFEESLMAVRGEKKNSITEDKKGSKAERKEQIMDEEKHVFYDPDGVVEFSEAVREQIREDLVWLSDFTREKFGLTIPEVKRLTEEMLTVSI